MARWHWIDLVIAPLRWVERTRGWRRLVLLLVYLAVLLGVAGPLLREASLWRIPDIAPPVDRAQFEGAALPEAQNAAVVYREAANLLALRRSEHVPAQAVGGPGSVPPWSRADQASRDWLKLNDAALARWRDGTQRPDALFHHDPGRAFDLDDPQSGSMPSIDVRALIFLAMMAAGRAEAAGDLAAAWSYHLGIIRTVSHIQRHGTRGDVVFGAQILRQACGQASFWVDADPQTADLLRTACRDLAAVRPLLATSSTLVRAGYFDAERAILATGGRIEKPGIRPNDWSDQIILARSLATMQHALSNEPKRSLRILRLVTAGQLAQLDRPEGQRAPLISGKYQVFAIDDQTPAALRTIRPAALVDLAESSAGRDYFENLGLELASVRIGRDAFESLLYQVAERAYALDHNNEGPRVYGDLVPAYLDTLPEGTKLSDPLVAP